MKFSFAYCPQIDFDDDFRPSTYWIVKSVDLGGTVARCEQEVHAQMITYALNNTDFPAQDA